MRVKLWPCLILSMFIIQKHGGLKKYDLDSALIKQNVTLKLKKHHISHSRVVCKLLILYLELQAFVMNQLFTKPIFSIHKLTTNELQL